MTRITLYDANRVVAHETSVIRYSGQYTVRDCDDDETIRGVRRRWPNKGRNLRAVVDEFLDVQATGRYGYDLTQACGFSPGAITRVLRRLTEAGWLVSCWEDVGDSAGRPPRRLYSMTSDGAEQAQLWRHGWGS